VRIRRIEIRNFRRFRKPVVIDGLGDGLTVLAGDNEEGKSTVLKALRTVLFDRYKLRGADVQRLQPHGSDVQPEVKLDFEIGGARYSLHKGFIHQPFARLVTPEGPLLNMAAEEKLQQLLRYEPPGKGAAKLEHQGVFSLFFVEQGSGFDNLPVRSQVKQTLVSALEGEVGAVLGGEQGRAVIAGVAQRYAELFTAQAKPRGDLKKAAERVEQLAAELARLENELHSYDEKVDVLSKTRARLLRSEQERLLELAQERLEEQRREVQRIERLAERVKELQTAEELARAQHEAALGRWREREKKGAAATRAQARAEQQGQLLAAEREALGPDLEACAQLREALEATERELGEAERGVQDWEARRERARAKKSAEDLQRRLELAQAAQRTAEQARARLLTHRVDDRRLRELRRLERAVIEAEAGLQAVATRVELSLLPGQGLRIDGAPHDAGQPLLVTERTRLELVGIGTVTITPGASELGERTASAAAARQALQRALSDVAARDLQDAERQHAERAQLEAQEREQAQLVSTYVPEGLEAARAELLRAELALSQAPEGDAAVAELGPAEAEQRLAAARERLLSHKREAAARRKSWEREEQASRERRERVLRLSIEADGARHEAEAAAAALSAERAQRSDEELVAERRQREEQLVRAQAETAAARTALFSANPDEARQQLQARERAVKLIQSDQEAMRKQVHELEIELRTLGQTGLGERAQQLAGELTRARALAERQSRQAGAVKLLHETLQAAEREAKEAFLRPVQRHVQPYLNVLFPRCELVLDENELMIRHLRRDGTDEPFESLSIGTREQLAVITRLSFADLLRGQGQPAPVILDDALVYSDGERFDAMLRVLQKAAQHTQILVLTCRERDYQLLGAPLIRLASCVDRAA
jgi:hypothetical protein